MKSKNIHVLKTDKPSKLYFNHNKEFEKYQFSKEPFINGLTNTTNQHIYITSSDEEIKQGDWYITGKFVWQMKYPQWGEEGQGDAKKITLTTDQDLIKDGVQAIDDEFLEWFVKNPSCEEVEVEVKSWVIDKEWDETYKQFNPIYPQKTKYKIIIPKQETLEEVNFKVLGTKTDTFYNGAKWQAERMYSEEEVIELLKTFDEKFNSGIVERNKGINNWFEQFKKK